MTSFLNSLQIEFEIVEREARRLPRPLTGLRAAPTYESRSQANG